MCDGIAAVILAVFVALVGGFSGYFGYTMAGQTQHTEIKQQALDRGYALFCPKDGRFAWKGECDD